MESQRQSLNDSRPKTLHNHGVHVRIAVCVHESCNRELYYHLFPHMLICLAVTRTSSSIALLFFPSPTPCLFQSPSPSAPSPPPRHAPLHSPCEQSNKITSDPKSRPLSQWLSNYGARRAEMESSHFNQKHVCQSVSVCDSVPAEAIRWSWCLTERQAGRMEEWKRGESSLALASYCQFALSHTVRCTGQFVSSYKMIFGLYSFSCC